MLVTLASMHGIFEAAGSLSVMKNMKNSAPIETQLGDPAKAECCDDDIIELSTVAFHCPLDGKILTTGLNVTGKIEKQVHISCYQSLSASISTSFFFRPPIV